MASMNNIDGNILKDKRKSSFKNGKNNVKKVKNTNKECKPLMVEEKENIDNDKELNGKLLFIEFSWKFFDLVVISQIILSISFLLLGFLYFILGSTFSEVATLGLLSFYLFLPTIPAYKSLANANTYSGILAFCFIQIGEVLQNTFTLTSILYSNDVLEVKTIGRCYLVGIVVTYQILSIIIVTLCPFKKVKKETLKRLFGTSNENDLNCITGNHQKIV
ncbi:Hypothetical protein SRAE_1000330200 [Strongyloides ratti]|uniref:Uncharacterized protein n=1 Tax=Strongyloides ratti TaxID=34506 RepID=A0A090MX96_STRRB|nr:Hypothetical protein SRAE_1000330200 [Strongyloides ratti]CEF65049.1 Hypothetical protein SRAE_1000330200 [Strongyloides ratti]